MNLLNDAREKSEELIDFLYQSELHGKKPRTYRRKARKLYLAEAQKKSSTLKVIRKANGKQLAFLRRNIGLIHRLLDKYQRIPFDKAQYKYFLVIQTLYQQQEQMHKEHLRSIEHRIVSIHASTSLSNRQPHVRPIVRGKRNAKVEFGSKIQVSMMNGFSFLDDLDWEAFNEGSRLKASVEKYFKRFGFYPAEVLADKIYCTRENRKFMKEMGIKLRAKPLGRPSSCTAVEDHVRPGERNPIEGVFGQGKTAYGMNRIKARLARTSESWIATILMVINLVKITGLIRHALMIMVAGLREAVRAASYFDTSTGSVQRFAHQPWFEKPHQPPTADHRFDKITQQPSLVKVLSDLFQHGSLRFLASVKPAIGRKLTGTGLQNRVRQLDLFSRP